MPPPPLLQVLKALANETRVDILVLLGTEGAFSVGEIADRVGLSAPTVSLHLKDLRHAHVVEQRREGKYVYYSLNRDSLSRNLDAVKALLTCC